MTVLGWQTPPIYSLPEIQVGSLGQECIDLAAMAGLHLDPWQQWFVYHTLSYTPERVLVRDGNMQHKWSAIECGLMVSRQNGKGGVLEALELAWLFLCGDQQIIHSAHEFRTSMKHMERMVNLVDGDSELRKRVLSIRRSNGSEGIVLRTGQELAFTTRTKGGSRGWSAEKIVLDEAMFVTPQQIAAIMPTQLAMPNAQRVLTGSAGDKDSLSFGSMRRRGMDEDNPDPRLFWAEWSIVPHTEECLPGCDEHDEIDSTDSYTKANPAYGIRISHEDIEASRRNLVDAPEYFLQEYLGVGDWPSEFVQWSMIGKDAWFGVKEETSEITSDVFVLGVHTSQDLKFSCITACGGTVQGKTHIEITGRGSVYDYRPGTSWVVARVLQIVNEWNAAKVVIDKRGQAGVFIEELEALGIEVVSPTGVEYSQACGDFYLDVVPPKNGVPNLVHRGQPAMNVSVAAADKHVVSNTWFWESKLPNTDISPLRAATLARWGYLKSRATKPRGKPWVLRM